MTRKPLLLLPGMLSDRSMWHAQIEGLSDITEVLVGHFREAHISKKIITITLFIAAIATNIALYVFLSGDGSTKEILRIGQVSSPDPRPLAEPNPANVGQYPILTTFYGAGSDIRRPEYGKSVAIKTKTIDASLFFKDFKGWKEKLRRRYWGFGMDKLPLNARVSAGSKMRTPKCGAPMNAA